MLSTKCFILGPDHSFLFAYIPKVACTNWKCVMRHLHGFEDYLDPAKAHNENRNGLELLSQLSDPWSILSDKAVPKYTCVRNPYTRVLSAYLNKIEPFLGTHAVHGGKRFDPHYHDIFRKVDDFRKLFLPDKEAVDFEAFVCWIEMSDISERLITEIHWRPQTAIIGNGQVDFDHIARFENLERDAPLILAAMGARIPFPTQQEVRFAPTRADNLVHQYYNERTAERVRRIYHNDFVYLNYDFSLRLSSDSPDNGALAN